MYMGADMARIITCGMCQVMWLHDTSHTKTRGMDGRCGSVKCWVWEQWVLGMWVSSTGMHGCMEADDRCGGQTLGHRSRLEWVTDVEGGCQDTGLHGEG